MAYIYKIVNDVNYKVYIGKTDQAIEERFKQHCKESKRERSKDRPLYRAMNQYGIEHFSIEMIEETKTPEDRERFWIEKYESCGSKGYNATLGGDGKRYLDYEKIIELYKRYHNASKVSEELGCDRGWVLDIAKKYGLSVTPASEISQLQLSKRVAKVNPENNEIIEIYPSEREAERKNGNTRHIGSVCNGKRRTCKGYKWIYLEQDMERDMAQ